MTEVSERCNFSVFEDGKGGQKSKECNLCREAVKIKETVSSLEPPERNTTC